jgi:hypothetical protein
MMFPILFCRNIHGKLCFGYEECGQFAAAEKAGDVALDHTPNDIWYQFQQYGAKSWSFL